MSTFIITLTKSRTCEVDKVDGWKIANYSWCYSRGYAYTSIDGKLVGMHRLLTDCPDGLEVDHINGNGLDNRQVNLRIVTRGQNNANRHVVRGRSKYKGVSWGKQVEKWRCYIDHGKKREYLGYFILEDDAARAYNAAAKRLYGEHAHLNEVPDGPT